jgi:Zn-dependent protease
VKLLLARLAAGKLGKLALTAGTMAISVFAYSLVYGWRYAVGFVALLFIHETGHVLAARRAGLPVSAPLFIPFVGAWITLPMQEIDARTEADIALAGPLLGTAAAYVCYLFWLQGGDRLWLALAYAGFFLNLFNLIPLRPLDGGRVARVVSGWFWVLGVAGVGAAFFWRPSPLLLLIAVAAAPEVLQALKNPKAVQVVGIPMAVRLRYGAIYFVLAIGLALASFAAHERLSAH